MAQLMPPLQFSATDANGNPLAGGKLYSYNAGTTTPKATFTDMTGGTANPNPVVLDSTGKAAIYLDNEPYKFVLQDTLGNVLWTKDGITTFDSSQLTIDKFATGLFTADTPGRAPFAAGFVNLGLIANGALENSDAGRAKMAPGFLSATATGQALMAPGFLSADTTGRALMADGFVTAAKLAGMNVQQSASTGIVTAYSPPSGTSVTTYASVTITPTGRPVILLFTPDQTGNPAYLRSLANNATGRSTFSSLQVGSTNIALVGPGYGANANIPLPTLIVSVEIPAASSTPITYTAASAIFAGSACSEFDVAYMKLVAIQL